MSHPTQQETPMTETKTKRIFDPCTLTWRFSDGSGVITQEKKIERELFDLRWRLNHESGIVDINKMIEESKRL